MDIMAFILVSIGIIIIPGPNILVIVSTSITNGKIRGLQTVAGTSSAMLIQLAIAALATSWLITTLAIGLVWLKWLGVIYLFYIGVTHLITINSDSKSRLSAVGSFSRGFWVSLTNPKTILFFGAFLPQFTNSGSSYSLQITLLSLIFWVLAVVLDSSYALLANKISSFVQNKYLAKYKNTVSGIIYLGAGSILATTNNR